MKTELSEILKQKNFDRKDEELITKAYDFAKKVHGRQKLDGTKHPYFEHPAYAGLLLAKWNRGAEEISAGLLHDVFEDCEVSLETLRRMFGDRICFIVDGMSWERKWNPKEKRYLKDWEGFHRKRLSYIKEDLGVLFVLFTDEISNLKDIFPDKYKRYQKPENVKSKKKRYSYIVKILLPFYKELGLNSLVKKVSELERVTGKLKSDLRNYISKKDVEKIKRRLDKIKEIDVLKMSYPEIMSSR